MTKPQIPNYTPGVGKLATTIPTFKEHTDGYAFRHQANQIDLFPTLVIDGTTYTDVQDALSVLITAVSGFVVPNATTGTSTNNLGIITLGGDLGGTALIPKVIAIQGLPINTTPPVIGNVLTWNGTSWGPTATSGSFSAGGDLSGTTSLQSVIGLTGSGTSPNRVLRASNDIIQFIATATPQLTQLPATGSKCSDLAIFY